MTTRTSTTDSRHRAWSAMSAPVEAGRNGNGGSALPSAAILAGGTIVGDATNGHASGHASGHGAAEPDPARRPRVLGLRCRRCERPEAAGPSYVCPACFGPLEVVYDLEAIRAQASRARIEAREPGIWRYLELLPVAARPERGLAVGSTPLLRADRLGAELGLRAGNVRLKDDTRNPTLSFKDRVVAIAAARAVEFGFDTLACASTGNLAGATAAAAANLGLRAVVFVPSDLEPAKIDHALSYGATVVPVDGTYDDINRLSLEIADEEGWAFVNVNLRPYYSEGSRTLAFEVAEQLGWRLPDVIVAPMASGSLFTKVAKGFDLLVDAGLVAAKPVRFIGAQAEGCSPVAAAFAAGSETITPVRRPETIVRSLAIGSPADGAYAVALARRSGGAVLAVPDRATAAAIRRLGRTEGVFAETAGGVTIAGLEQAVASGQIGPDDEVVALITGNGVKTPDAKWFGLDEARAGAGQGSGLTRGGGLVPAIEPSYAAFVRAGLGS
ncbi:MAG: threonine synthase [Chloroflexi bacterium]|nr:threonine synthase [Chloroflexota bacterium]